MKVHSNYKTALLDKFPPLVGHLNQNCTKVYEMYVSFISKIIDGYADCENAMKGYREGFSAE